MSVKICKRCLNVLKSYANQQQQYWRLIKSGCTPEETKQLLPRCGKCVTAYLKEKRK